MRKSDLEYYKIIGIPSNSNYEELKKAYRKLALELHPDKNKETEKDFIEITEAYQQLSKKYELINNILSNREKKDAKREKKTTLVSWNKDVKVHDCTNQRTSKNCCIYHNRLAYYEDYKDNNDKYIDNDKNKN
jgi:hypothetical protein